MASQAAHWQQGQPVARAAVVSKHTEPELLAAPWQWGAGDGTPSGQAGILLMPLGNKYHLWRGFRKRTVERGSGEATGQLQTLVRNKGQKSRDRAGSTSLTSGIQGP